MSSCSLSSMPGDKNPASTFDGRVNAGRILRELSESVLKTLTQIEPKSSSQAKDQQYQNLLRTRCQELKQYVESHPINIVDSTAAPAPCRKSWIDEQSALEEEDRSPIQSWLTNSNMGRRSDSMYSFHIPSDSELPSSTTSSSSSTLNLMSAVRYKTEMCRSVSEGGGICRYGDKCQYAHNRSELRPMPRHPRYKTQMCREYHLTSVCSYGVRCNFLHDEHKQPAPPTKPVVDDCNDVFTSHHQGTWSGSGCSSPEELLPSWTTSTTGLSGSTGEAHSPSIGSSESSPLWVSSPKFSSLSSQSSAFTPGAAPTLSGTSTSRSGVREFFLFPIESPWNQDSVWNRGSDNNVFQFPSSRVLQMQSIGEYDDFGNRF